MRRNIVASQTYVAAESATSRFDVPSPCPELAVSRRLQWLLMAFLGVLSVAVSPRRAAAHGVAVCEGSHAAAPTEWSRSDALDQPHAPAAEHHALWRELRERTEEETRHNESGTFGPILGPVHTSRARQAPQQKSAHNARYTLPSPFLRLQRLQI